MSVTSNNRDACVKMTLKYTCILEFNRWFSCIERVNHRRSARYFRCEKKKLRREVDKRSFRWWFILHSYQIYISDFITKEAINLGKISYNLGPPPLRRNTKWKRYTINCRSQFRHPLPLALSLSLYAYYSLDNSPTLYLPLYTLYWWMMRGER